METRDDRTKDQRQTHTYLVMGRDQFMSGWGRARGGTSYAAWACASQAHADAVALWVLNRTDITDVRIVRDMPDDPIRPQGKGHFHIYVVDAGHPALRR